MAHKTTKSANNNKSTKTKSKRAGRSRNTSTTKITAKKRAQTESKYGSKIEVLLALLRRRSGASIDELIKATGWQPHSVRGFLSGTVRKKLGLKLTSTLENGVRRYRVKVAS